MEVYEANKERDEELQGAENSFTGLAQGEGEAINDFEGRLYEQARMETYWSKKVGEAKEMIEMAEEAEGPQQAVETALKYREEAMKVMETKPADNVSQFAIEQLDTMLNRAFAKYKERQNVTLTLTLRAQPRV